VEDAFLGKASLVTLLGGLAIYALALAARAAEVAMVTLLLALVLSVVLGFSARRNRIGRLSLGLSGALLLLGAVNFVLFTIVSR
jgi:hypothetical protein